MAQSGEREARPSRASGERVNTDCTVAAALSISPHGGWCFFYFFSLTPPPPKKTTTTKKQLPSHGAFRGLPKKGFCISSKT